MPTLIHYSSCNQNSFLCCTVHTINLLCLCSILKLGPDFTLYVAKVFSAIFSLWLPCNSCYSVASARRFSNMMRSTIFSTATAIFSTGRSYSSKKNEQLTHFCNCSRWAALYRILYQLRISYHSMDFQRSCACIFGWKRRYSDQSMLLWNAMYSQSLQK